MLRLLRLERSPSGLCTSRKRRLVTTHGNSSHFTGGEDGRANPNPLSELKSSICELPHSTPPDFRAIIQIYSGEKMLRLRISYETALMGLMQLFRTERYYSSRRAHNMRRLLTYCEMRNASILPGLLMPTQQSQTMAMPSSPLIKCQ